jgi:hypothetical protein
MGRDKAVQNEQEAGLNTLMGSVAAHLLIASVAERAEMVPAVSLPALKIAKIPAAELLGGVARACVLGEWAGLRIALPRDWNQHLIAALNLPDCPVDASQMLALGAAALDNFSAEPAYAASAAGLAKGSANAEFLLLRARSLPPWASVRREGCLRASLELARRERDTELAGRILDCLNRKQQNGRRWRGGAAGMNGDPAIASRTISPELLGKILEEEQTMKRFPGNELGEDPKYAEELGYFRCDCPRCRAKRGETNMGGYEYVDDDEDEDEFDDEGDFAGPGPLPDPDFLKGLGKLMGLSDAEIKELRKAFAGGENPKITLDKILGERRPRPQSPASSKKNEKSAKAVPPEQGSLF